jgi:hypothetical protein
MTWRPDRQCFTFKRQASPKELLPANVNRTLFFEEARSPHKRELPLRAGDLPFLRTMNARFPPNCDVHGRGL